MLAEGLREIRLAELRESPGNPRQITPARYDSLRRALATDPEMLQARPLIALPDGEVICGNMRLRALRDLGVQTAPTYVSDLDPARRREWLLRDNNEYGDWVPSEVAALVARHRDEGGDLDLLGFAEPELEALLAAEDGPPPPSNDKHETTTAESFALICECRSEDDQASLIDELVERGYEVRPLLG